MSAQPSTTPRVRDTWRELATWIQAQFAGPWRDLPLVRNPEMGERPLPRHVLYPHLLAANASRQLVDLSNRYGVSSETAGWRIVAVLTIVDTVTGNPRLMFALVKPGPPKPSRKPDPDDSHNWSKGWKTIP